jgi:hypothetical protein
MILDPQSRETQSLSKWLIASPQAYRIMFPLDGPFPASEVKARLIEWRKLHQR